ncbi:MAG TPA: TetR/AcrR family transcriptional regulator [Gemmatimonadaceae bacterium]|nr:TetR/AcrR family transcriptional regulator [Gemmatimonadaceae bacterium]
MSAHPTPHSEPRWRRLPEERPRQILEAALEVFGERGLGQARLDDIAKRAGLSKGTIYLYFPNKEELFREVVRSVLIERIERAEREADARSGSASEQLAEYMREWWRFLHSGGYATLHRLVIGELHAFPDLAEFYAREVIQRAHRLLAGMIRRGIDAGEFRSIDPMVAARMISSMSISQALWCKQRDVFKHTACPANDAVVLDQLLDFVFSALRPDHSTHTKPAHPRPTERK